MSSITTKISYLVPVAEGSITVLLIQEDKRMDDKMIRTVLLNILNIMYYFECVLLNKKSNTSIMMVSRDALSLMVSKGKANVHAL